MRDWKTTYAAPAAAAQHTAPYPAAAVAGRRLVAFVAAPATVAVPAGWTEHADPLGQGELSAATATAAGGETSVTWDRDPSTSTAPRTLAAWLESRDDLGEMHGAPLVYSGLVVPITDEVTLDPIVTTVDGCRLYVAISTYDNPYAWVPTFSAPVALEDVVAGPGHGFETARLAVASGVASAGSHTITISNVPRDAALQVVAFAVAPAAGSEPPPADNPIEAENRKTGTAQAVWDVTGAGDPTIQGYATADRVDLGGTITVKVNSPASAWTGTVYRLGHYSGAGARQVATITGPQTAQPAGTVDPTTLAASCANWAANGSWTVPADATPGLYLIKIARDDQPALASHICPFVVRDPNREAPIAVKLSDPTWWAYNHAGADPADPFAGRSLYGAGTAAGFVFDTGQRARAVSYDRPLVTRLHLPQTSFFNAEYPLVRWLERLGYDVDYVTSAQVDADPTVLTGRAAVISSGHDEYWSAGMRDAFEAARDHTSDPTHLLFLSGNEAFWRIHWTEGRRGYLCAKDSHDGQINPTGLYGGTWQDGRSFNPSRRPPATLTGQRFRLNGLAAFPLAVPDTFKASPLWRHTAVADLAAGQTWTSPAGIVGFEGDEPADTHTTEKPAGLIRLSQVTHQVAGMLADDNGVTYTGSGPYVHALTAYRAASGAVVFGAGTVQYAWALDDTHDRHPGGSLTTPVLQQALVNLLADLGVLPPAYPFPGGLTRPTPVALTAYGFPATEEPPPPPPPPITLDPTTPVGMVRLLITDTDPAAPLLTDAQITALLAVEGGNVKRGAAVALETIATSETLIGKKITTQDLSTDGPAVAKALMDRAKTLRDQADSEAGAIADPDAYGFDYVDFPTAGTHPGVRWSPWS